MFRLKRSVPGLLGIAVVCGCFISFNLPAAEDPPAVKETPTQKFMRAKLTDTQKVLEGITTENYKLIEDGADHMAVMSRVQQWNVIPGPEYLQHSAEFRRCCEDLKKRAQRKDLDACALSHLQLTMSCISCHKFVRSTRIVRNGRRPNVPADEHLTALLQSHAGEMATKNPNESQSFQSLGILRSKSCP